MNIVANLPAIKPEMVTTAAPVPLQSVDAHSLLHRKCTKAAKACDGADILDGLLSLRNLTIKLVAAAVGVSVSSIVTALRLTPTQRDEVRRGKRPLVVPTKPVPLQLPPPVVAVTVPSAEQRLKAAANEFGLVEALEVLAKLELASAA
jgi:hypothetical protein